MIAPGLVASGSLPSRPLLKIITTCAFGVEDLLEDELAALGLQRLEVVDGSVTGAGDWAAVWRVNMRVRLGRRVLVELADWWAHDLDGLRRGAAELVENDPGIAVLLDPDCTLGVYATCSASKIDYPGAASRAAVQGLLDGQRARSGVCSEGVSRDPEIPLRMRLHRNLATLLLDTSGADLDDRPKREPRPVRNTMAAALAEVAGPREVIYDPWPEESHAVPEWLGRAADRGPNVNRERWPFLGLPGHDADSFKTEWQASRGTSRGARVLRSWEDASRARGGLLIGCPPLDWDEEAWRELGKRMQSDLRGWRAVLLARGLGTGRALKMRPKVHRQVRDGKLFGMILGFDLERR